MQSALCKLDLNRPKAIQNSCLRTVTDPDMSGKFKFFSIVRFFESLAKVKKLQVMFDEDE
ncbi:MAG: hypothetical protein CL599_11795 [Alteromonas sp.]|jgi:hypothetical protein|nr:hypothetical protein [Alteromonas sp.]OUX86183.1 MAG: hypothetical protein CBB95_11615 [Alteromonas sp. TMED35]|tara:strand:+ start:25582 stop:25761 length:180 start_codon:yes stop_codon:yes gene_type:complete